MKKLILSLCILMMIVSGCSNSQNQDNIKIGVSLGVGSALRWEKELAFMEEYAKELDIKIDARLSRAEDEKTQIEVCKEMMDAGIEVLILKTIQSQDAETIAEIAKEKGVKIISYSRAIAGQAQDIFVGYDSTRIGQMMGQYISELVYEGDVILLHGDENDNNSKLLYNGAMQYIDPIKGNLNILLDENVPNWSGDTAKIMVKEAIMKNNNQIDAILAPNDKLAGACIEALKELGIEKHVVITGMDAELEAVQRIVEGTQDMTVFLPLQELAESAVDAAYALMQGKPADINAKYDNQNGILIDAILTSGKVVTKQNIDSILIDSGYLTKTDVYGE